MYLYIVLGLDPSEKGHICSPLKCVSVQRVCDLASNLSSLQICEKVSVQTNLLFGMSCKLCRLRTAG